MEASLLVTGQIDHNRHRPVGADPAGAPDVLIDSQGLHTGQAFGLRDPGLGFGLDRGPGGVPGDAEMTGQRRDGGVVMAECVGGPPDRSYRQHRPRRRDRMPLGERCRGTTRLQAPPDSGQPTHHRHSAQAGRVVQHSAAAAVPDREHPTAGTAVLKLIRRDGQHQPLMIIDVNFGHVHAGNVEHRIGPGTPAHTRTTHTVGHRRGLRQTAWSLLILKASTPSPPDQHANRAQLTEAHLRRPRIAPGNALSLGNIVTVASLLSMVRF